MGCGTGDRCPLVRKWLGNGLPHWGQPVSPPGNLRIRCGSGHALQKGRGQPCTNTTRVRVAACVRWRTVEDNSGRFVVWAKQHWAYDAHCTLRPSWVPGKCFTSLLLATVSLSWAYCARKNACSEAAGGSPPGVGRGRLWPLKDLGPLRRWLQRPANGLADRATAALALL